MTFKRSFLDKLTGVNSGYDSLPCFLKSVVNNTKNGHVTLFGFSTKDGGHAVLITGCKYDKSKKEYKVTIFDENSANPNSIGHFSTMTISKDFKSFSYSEENLKNSTYKCMYILDWAKIKKLGTDISEGRETNKKYNYIKMPADYSCTITDEYGCILEYDGENFSGDMDIYSIDTVESDNKLYYKFSIDGSSINVSDVDSKVDVTLYNDNDFVSLSGENIDEADISVNNGINITGNDYNFNAFVSTDEFVSKNEKNLISVSADAQGETKLEKETKDVVVNSDELDNIQVSQHVATKSLSYSVASTDSFSATEVLSKHKHVFQNGYCTECGKYDLLSTIPEIKLNEEKTVNIKNENEEQYYKFSPSESGTYSICSFGDCDTYGTLYDENMNIIDYNDDGKSYNYMIEPYLNSNKTYIIGSKMYGSELGSFTIKVSKLNNDDENNDTNSSSNNSTKETPISKANNKGSENIIVPASTEQNNSIIVTAPKLKSVKTGKKQFKATWKKVKGVVGYQIQYSTTKKFTKKTTKSAKIKKANTTSKTIKKLKSGKKYFVRIRAYKKVGDKVVYSKWSKVKKVTVKYNYSSN
ncbi:MAG: fibronectin type III domain-containing protein [Eubacterium sp.]|nr:fibronectin type III domain-containing protein [Eubacterium sp.]